MRPLHDGKGRKEGRKEGDGGTIGDCRDLGLAGGLLLGQIWALCRSVGVLCG